MIVKRMLPSGCGLGSVPAARPWYGRTVTTPNLCPSPLVTVRGQVRSTAWSVYDTPELLFAGAVRIRLRLVDRRPVIQIGDAAGDVVNELRHTPVLVEVEVLRFVRHLVIVAVATRGEEHDRDAVTRVHVVIAAAVDVL